MTRLIKFEFLSKSVTADIIMRQLYIGMCQNI